MSHSPYCTDLAPNDYFLFPYVKNKMRGGQRFSALEEAVDDAFRMHVLQKCFNNWFKRLQKCRDVNREHFEKQ